MILAATTDWHERGLTGGDPAGLSRKVKMQYQIVIDGKVVQRTRGAPARPFLETQSKKRGFADVQLGADEWRVFHVPGADPRFSIEVAQDHKRRREILVELAEHLILPMLAMLTVTAAASWFALGRMMRPIAATALAITAKSRDDLMPLDTAEQPVELLPIVDSLNDMLARLDATLQAERRFTADAAHELRTPLAAVHMQAQLIERQHPGLARSFARLRSDIERSTKLVDSLLMLARLDPLGQNELTMTEIVLPQFLDELARSHSDEAGRRGISIKTDCLVNHISGDPALLRIALRNLVDNALRYCEPGCVVNISARWIGDSAQLCVSDDGPGVSAEDRARLSERFFRVLGSRRDGHGLGLSIVKRIVELHGATLSFRSGDRLRGLGVAIDFAGPRASMSSGLYPSRSAEMYKS
jgi:two-component system sensor histidine kinase QseC